MKLRLSIILFSVITIISTHHGLGQSQRGTIFKSSFGASVGGLSDFKDGSFLFSQVDYGIKKHITLNFTLHRDVTRERWSDGSKGDYLLYSPGLGARFSTKENGRGFFVQAGINYAFASLKVSEANGFNKQNDNSTLGANWKLGYRWSRKPKGLFLEAILNYTVSWNDLILQTDAAPANSPAKRPTLDWHSWNNYKGDIGQTFLLGIGYTF